MVRYIKENKDINYVNLFLFVVNGQEPRFDKGTRLLIQIFANAFTYDFWRHMCVVYTRWSNDEASEERRGELTEDDRTEQILAYLHDHAKCPKEINPHVFFTDAYELGSEDFDDVQKEIYQTMYTIASTQKL